jgi:hypothetical protein
VRKSKSIRKKTEEDTGGLKSGILRDINVIAEEDEHTSLNTSEVTESEKEKNQVPEL